MTDVKYDFNAAESLVSALVQLNDKLAGFGSMRAGLKNSQLSTWQGRKHDDWAADFDRSQAAIAGLAQLALTLRGQVDQATAEALYQKTH